MYNYFYIMTMAEQANQINAMMGVAMGVLVFEIHGHGKPCPYGKSIIPQRVDGVQFRGLVGGQVAEEDADAHRHTEAEEDGPHGGGGVEGNAAGAHARHQHAAQENDFSPPFWRHA